MGIPSTVERDVAELRTRIADLTKSADTKHQAAEDLVASEKKAGRNPVGGTTDDDRDSFTRIDAAYKEADADRQSAAELKAKLHDILDHWGSEVIDRAGGDPANPAVAVIRSLGAIVTASDSHKRFLASGQLGQDTGAVVYDPVQVLTKAQAKEFFGGRRSAGIRADAGDGTPLVPSDERLIPPVEIPKAMPTLLDLINVQATGRDAVTWAKQVARTTAATTTVAFGTALNKSRYTYTTTTSPVLRKGHYAVVDEGNIADQEEFQGIIDAELLSDLRLIVEADALSGAGGGDWTGIYNDGGVGNFDASTADNLADALHKAITTVRVALEAEPSAYGISPEDFEDFYLAKGTDGHYLHHRGPLEGGPRTVWGIPATVSTKYTSPLVGDFRRGATLWVREGVSIVIGRIDDQLLEGLYTVRAQTRAAFAVKQPKAFCAVSNFEEAES